MKTKPRRKSSSGLLCLLCLLAFNVMSADIPSNGRSEKAIANVRLELEKQLSKKSLKLGSAIFIRILKESDSLEVWMESESGRFINFKNYDICTFSGSLGPKIKEGDRQSPEGFYFVKPNNLNPWSRFHLSFNLGFPNQYDRYHGRTGSALMVHGNCVSIGCYAMTDKYIEEIYTLIHFAFESGQPFVRVHAFPFHMTDDNLTQYKNHKWHAFWKNLKEGYDAFENQGRPPNVKVDAGRYVFTTE